MEAETITEKQESLKKQPSEGEVRRWKLDFFPCPRSDDEIGGECTKELISEY